MDEKFLHYLWKYRLFIRQLQTTDGDLTEINNPGEHNTDAGPDFFNARIKIGDTLWAGNVEIHVNASDWIKHGHQQDKAYNNIILHVVLNADETICRENGETIPTISLEGKFDYSLYERYLDFMNSRNWIPCEHSIAIAERFTVDAWLERLLVERLETKTQSIDAMLRQNRNNWEETFYQAFARNFGFRLNSLPFELLAKSLPLKYLGRHKNSLLQVEAMLFGQAGMLGVNFIDEYPQSLQKEYYFLQSKYSLKPIDGHLWRFLRLRPSNFPTIRLAQFAQLIVKSSALFSKIIESHTLNPIVSLLEVECEDYWQQHYVFDKPSVGRLKKLGADAIDLLLINTVASFLFLYGKQMDNPELRDKALEYLYEIAPERNSVIQHFAGAGLKAGNALQTQGLLQLKAEYCDKKRCLDCAIGHALLKM